MYGVSVTIKNSTIKTTTIADGHYILNGDSAVNTVEYRLDGFQGKSISGVTINDFDVTYLDVVLFPLAQDTSIASQLYSSLDSLETKDTLMNISVYQELCSCIHNPIKTASQFSDIITSKSIQPGTDKDATFLLRRLNGVIVQDNGGTQNIASLNIAGLGERYNQLIIDRTPVNSSDFFSRAYPLQLMPVNAIEKVSVQKIADPSVPADFAGGTISIKTKDIPDRNFYYVQVGTAFNDATTGKGFLNDKKNFGQSMGFAGSIRDLPSDFPTTRSRTALTDKNIQEQVSLSRQLNNNLSPINYGNSKPAEKIMLGFGKLIALKGGQKIGITAYVNQQQSVRIDQSTVQVSPVTANLFDANKVAIRSQAHDMSYQYQSQFSGIVNAAIVYGKNKVSFKSFFASQFVNTLTQRSQVADPSEDTLAHAGILY
ncbi:MAG: TonB-dependent receptor [Sphingobacteriales bacterium]|nr:TonB-dependent receptor [Sphingobacteriales bacterium]